MLFLHRPGDLPGQPQRLAGVVALARVDLGLGNPGQDVMRIARLVRIERRSPSRTASRQVSRAGQVERTGAGPGRSGSGRRRGLPRP